MEWYPIRFIAEHLISDIHDIMILKVICCKMYKYSAEESSGYILECVRLYGLWRYFRLYGLSDVRFVEICPPVRFVEICPYVRKIIHELTLVDYLSY